MINYIWFVMIFLGLVVGIFTGNGEGISNAIIGSIDTTVTFIIGLVGLMCFWCGVMKVAQNSGFTEKLAKFMKPILKLIFKDAAKDEKALGAIVMNITANMMGLGSAATPFGLKAMQELEKENPKKGEATEAMITFLILNTAGVTIIPTTVIALRMAHGSMNATGIILPSLLATLVASIAGLTLDYIIRRRRK